MDFNDYQQAIRATDQRPGTQLQDIAVHLLGLVGEAGSVASEYKKKLRDGDSHPMWKAHMRAELGDVLWYVAAVANKIGLDLDDVAQANLQKTRSRWLSTAVEPFDSSYPSSEQLPRSGRLEFRPCLSPLGRPAVEIYLDGIKKGDQLTDSSNVEDGYRFHDVFHLAYATVLGWSPVLRALLKCKRKSNPAVDENEDGGRGIVVEEGVAALVFAYASEHNYLEGIGRIDFVFLETIQLLVGEKEVGVRSAADWEKAILDGFSMFRQLAARGGGAVQFDADQRTLTYEPLQ
jgi:NTP pyrophosphatase (non-canonical NTP hydrolase)